MALQDNLAKLRSLAADKGYKIISAPRDFWFLVNDATGEIAVSVESTSAFSVERAIKFLSVERSGTKSRASR